MRRLKDDALSYFSLRALINKIMRRPIKKRPAVNPDVRFGSVEVERLINYIMLRGQKETARKIVYAAF